jgi:SAM-dependent methyltransferase
MQSIREGAQFPPGWGLGLNERVVEYPWLFAQDLSGSVLDAGSALNHGPLLDRLLPRIDRLHVVTLAPERRSFPDRGVSYLYEDIRSLPYRDRVFDHVVCLSTLEHVGMDNSGYAGGAGKAADPQAEAGRAVDELLRVLRPGGTLFVSVPYGRPDDHGWFRVFAREDVDALRARSETTEVAVFGYTADAWSRADLDRAAESVYRDRSAEPAPADLAANARAVACIALTR